MKSIKAPGTAKLKATFSNAHNTLWPGQYVNARVLVRTERNVLTVPTPRGAARPEWTLHLCRQGRFHGGSAAAWSLGVESGGLTVITKGIALNERVVTSNQYRLQAGVHVRDNAAAPKAS